MSGPRIALLVGAINVLVGAITVLVGAITVLVGALAAPLIRAGDHPPERAALFAAGLASPVGAPPVGTSPVGTSLSGDRRRTSDLRCSTSVRCR